MTTVNSITAMKALNPASSSEVYVSGYYNPGDLGGGEFYYDFSSSATTNDGTIFASTYTGTGRWFRVLNGTRVNARWFGAHGDGSTDDTTFLQNAIDYCGANQLGLYLSQGTYIVSAANAWTPCLRIHNSNFFMEGDGAESEIKGANSNANAALVKIVADSGQIQNVVVKNIKLNGNNANQSGAWHNYGIVVFALNSITDPLNVTLEGLFCHSAYTNDGYEGGGINVLGDDQTFSKQEYPTQNVIVKNCFCWDNQGWGIGTNFSNGVIISNNVCWNNTTQGITIWNTQDSILDGNRCYSNGSIGINLEISDRITISNNSIDSSLLSAIRLFNSIDIVITGNSCQLSASYWEYSTLGIKSGPGYYTSGAYKKRPCKNIQISSNVLNSIGSDGNVVRIFNEAIGGPFDDNEAIVLNDNIINNSVTFKGIDILATDVTLSNNKVFGCVAVVSSAGFIIVDSNDILFNNSPSTFNLVTINDCQNLVIKGNLLRCNQYGDGAICLLQYITNAIVFDNIMQGAFSQYIRVDYPAVTPATRDNLSW